MAFSSGSSSQSCEINVTPLIDVLLVLLIIFMVIVPITPRGLDSSIPQGKASNVAALPPVIVKMLAGNGSGAVTYKLGEQELAYVDLWPAMRSMFAQRESRTVFVEADRSLPYQQVAAVVSEAHQAGAGQVALNGLQPR